MRNFKNLKINILIGTLLITILLATYNNVAASIQTQGKNYVVADPSRIESKEILYRDFLLTQLSPLISDAVQNYYGYPKSFDLFDAKVLEIKRLEKGSFYFNIIIQVITYEGAHNPPYGLETVTIRQDYKGIRVTDFKHSDYIDRSSN
ncbi:DUF3888 domain-containing protein [Ruminiclostridium josui]|uniref:DUF3888 domain-containing protein n=1 Tax=Ruminiclostridium josui TaxID=1499 RepID=UPI000467718B|nr:DUF3888 domain-containing protein [Ruminiclostridium josui]